VSGASLFNTRQAFLLAAVFVVFGIVWFVEGARHTAAMGNSYTRSSILEKYRKIDIRERRKRDVVRQIFSVLFDGAVLHRMDIGNRNYSAQIAVSNDAASRRLETRLKQAGLTKERTDGKIVYLKGAL